MWINNCVDELVVPGRKVSGLVEIRRLYDSFPYIQCDDFSLFLVQHDPAAFYRAQ